jgi:hypothetical protein
MVARRTAVVMTVLAMIVGANCGAAAAASSPGLKTARALDASSPAHAAIPTCKATDIVSGSPASGLLTTQGDQSIIVQQPIRNVGATCVFVEPERVRAEGIKGAPALLVGEFAMVPITNSGHAQSWVLKHGGVATIVLRSWWPTGRAISPNFCRSSIAGVTRVEIPLSGSWLKISLPTIRHHSVCVNSATLSIGVDLG